MSLFSIDLIHRWGNTQSGNGLYEILIEISKDLKLIYKQNQKIIMTQTEMAEKLDGVTTKLVKIGEESKKTLQAVADLKVELANQEKVAPALQAAFDKLEAQATVVDDLVPDPVENPIEEPLPGGPGGNDGPPPGTL